MQDPTMQGQDNQELAELLQTTDELTPEELSEFSEEQLYISPVILALPDSDRPAPSPACETCPAALWFKTKSHLKCFCSRMHSVVWETGMEAPPILLCDGRELALLAMQKDD